LSLGFPPPLLPLAVVIAAVDPTGEGAPATIAAPAEDLAERPTTAADAEATALSPRPRRRLVVRRVFPPDVIGVPPPDDGSGQWWSSSSSPSSSSMCGE
jgi:hypothetical protein